MKMEFFIPQKSNPLIPSSYFRNNRAVKYYKIITANALVFISMVLSFLGRHKEFHDVLNPKMAAGGENRVCSGDHIRNFTNIAITIVLFNGLT